MSTVPFSDDVLLSRLQSAEKQCRERQYNQCLKTLQTVKGDPKTHYDTIVVQFLAGAIGSREALTRLKQELAPTPTGSGGVALPSLAICYKGCEFAQYSTAVFLYLSGLVDECTVALRGLLTRAPSVDPQVAVRAAVLLYVVTGASRSGSKRRRTQSDEQLINDTLQRHEPLRIGDPVLCNMHRLVSCSSAMEMEVAFTGSTKDPADQVAMLNNMGVLALNDERRHLAAVYLAKAASLCGTQPICALQTSTVMYNAALAALARREYGVALKALSTVQDTLGGSPLMWMRMAQAAFGVADTNAKQRIAKIHVASQDALGLSILDRVAIPAALPLHQVPQPIAGAPPEETERRYVSFAVVALQAALELFAGEGTLRAAAERLAAMGGNDVRALQYALAMYAYGLLAQGNYAAAVTVAQDVLALHRVRPLPNDVHMAVVLYAVEGLCHVGRPAIAMRVLQACNLGELLVASPNPEQQRHNTEALFVSLCVVHILKGSLSSAQLVLHGLVAKAAAKPDASPAVVQAAVLLQAFLELRQGNRDRALEALARGAF